MQYIKEHKQFVYLNLLTSGMLNEYLASIDEQAESDGTVKGRKLDFMGSKNE